MADSHPTQTSIQQQFNFDAAAVATEEWRPVAGPFDYEVSDLGQVRSWAKPGRQGGRRDSPLIVKPYAIGKGYLGVALYAHGKTRRAYVHRLVLEAFVGLCPEGMQALHENGNRADNRLANLSWRTPDEDVAARVRRGSLKPREAKPEYEPVLFADRFIPVEAIIPGEVWKPIPDYPGYVASNRGGIGSYWVRGHTQQRDHMSTMTPQLMRSGHLFLGIRRSDRKVSRAIHRLVIEAFSPQVDPSTECRHIDGDPQNNHISNLRWGSHRENMRDRSLHGTDNRGERSANAKLTEADIQEIRRRRGNGERPCHLAREYAVSQSTIRGVCCHATWSHVA